MNPDFLDGLRASRRRQLYDPARNGQWRRGYECRLSGERLAACRRLHAAHSREIIARQAGLTVVERCVYMAQWWLQYV